MTQSIYFQGFTPAALQYLHDVRANNSKSWYEANKDNYRKLLLAPFQALVADLSDAMLTLDPNFITIPAVGKTLSRIYRDTRFSKDKSLYRDSMWLTFKRLSPDWKVAPAIYFEIDPEGYRYGMGIYEAPRPLMEKFRSKIVTEPYEFMETISFYRETDLFQLAGEKYKKTVCEGAPEAVREWCQYKYFYLTSEHRIDDLIFGPRLVPELIAGFSLLAPLYHYLWEIKKEMDAEF